MAMFTQSTLTDKIEHAVVHNPHLNIRKMHFSTAGNRVVINGRVESFFEKQMAQEAVKQVDGVEAVVNHLEVTWN